MTHVRRSLEQFSRTAATLIDVQACLNGTKQLKRLTHRRHSCRSTRWIMTFSGYHNIT